MSEQNAPPAPPGRSRPDPGAEPTTAQPGGGEVQDQNKGGNDEPRLPETPPDTREPGGSQMGDGARLDQRGQTEEAPPIRAMIERPETGNPYPDVPEMKPGHYRKSTPGRIRNPNTGTVYTNTTATQVVEPDGWDRSQLKAGIIDVAPGNQNRSV